MIKKLKYKVRRIEFEPPRENTGVKVFVFLMAALRFIFLYILHYPYDFSLDKLLYV